MGGGTCARITLFTKYWYNFSARCKGTCVYGLRQLKRKVHAMGCIIWTGVGRYPIGCVICAEGPFEEAGWARRVLQVARTAP